MEAPFREALWRTRRGGAEDSDAHAAAAWPSSRRSQKWSLNALPIVASSPHAGAGASIATGRMRSRPSLVTRRQNAKAQWSVMRINSEPAASESSPSLPAEAFPEDADLRAQRFSEEAEAVERMLHDLSRAMRSRPSEDIGKKLRGTLAEVPQGVYPVTAAKSRRVSVPMQRLDVHGCRGREQVEVVDVRKLRARCLQLGQGTTVRSLLQLQRYQGCNSPSVPQLLEAKLGAGASGSPGIRERRPLAMAARSSLHAAGGSPGKDWPPAAGACQFEQPYARPTRNLDSTLAGYEG
mmetsp:Transcript_66727/g.145520  ORF Transcript_66727/g.145520 Transcript_66727/m.145520 type:complete len:294 (+) Transcript_66727:59-940(+)